jgi:hypothetical protein
MRLAICGKNGARFTAERHFAFGGLATTDVKKLLIPLSSFLKNPEIISPR